MQVVSACMLLPARVPIAEFACDLPQANRFGNRLKPGHGYRFTLERRASPQSTEPWQTDFAASTCEAFLPIFSGALALWAASCAAGARGLRPRSGRAGGSATPTSYTARASIEAVNALTFEVDPSVAVTRKMPILLL